MAQTLKYVIGKDYRPLTMLEAKSSNVSNIDYGANPNWVQARQYEDGLRQVFVEIANEDGTPFDLTGANVLFEGVLPDNEHKILDNEHAVFYEDPTSGKFRFDLPAQAFTVAGQYKQSFFRVMKGYKNIATLEFKLQVLADWVIGGLTPSDYISPLEKFFSQINDELLADKNKLKQAVDEFKQEVNDIQKAITDKSDAAGNMLDSLTQRIVTLETKIKNDDLFTNSDAVEYKLKINDEINDLKLSLLNTDKNLQTKATEISNKFDENLQTKTTKISDEFNEKIDKLNKTVTSSMSEAKTLVENKIAQMDNGVHGYPNANAIKQAYPNGAQGIFVAVDTGHQWYYVNGQWTDGGAYQSPRGNADATATALHNQMLDALDQQDKIWQRKLYVNVNTGEWLNDKNMRETQSNWCWTPYYTPVKKNSDYIFAGYDGVSATLK
ncbi:phage baseplate upper protein [Ligilactobacillus hayakitensis]|uniref:phage baseplate upper protein n=1 Tax=Ligilactobacillus hayakitensis TaxID=396716 RepID=UPI0004686878|nr:phage baseplate upper protein [Ligilactobacillus hayakitensis]